MGPVPVSIGWHERRLMKAIAIPSRYRLRVKQRLAVVQYAVAHGIKPASRHFGLERKTIRRWRARWVTDGVTGLVPRYRKERVSRLPAAVLELIGHARRELKYGAPRTRIWLRRVHQHVVSLATIQRIFRKLGLGRLSRGSKRLRKPRQLKLFEKAEPGESVQVVVKVGGAVRRSSTRRSTTAPATGSSGSIRGRTSGRVWTSSES
jgi:transposase